jgi:hypothetical protein
LPARGRRRSVTTPLVKKTPHYGEPVKYIEYTGLITSSCELPTSFEVVFV